MAGRVFAILAAVLLVGAFALATLMAPDLSLGAALFLVSDHALRAAHDGISAHLGSWAWSGVAVPLLLRPVWLIPAGLGLVCTGAALTLATRPPHHRSRRRS
ncbi:MAG: hypothetical protein ACREF1_02545 [Acetobacteraceae bacterium]